MNDSLREIEPRHTGALDTILRTVPTLAAAMVLGVGPAPAQSQTVLTDGNGLTVTIGGNGITRLTRDAEVWQFADVDPVVVRITNLAGGRMTWSHFTGSQMLGTAPRVESGSATRCSVVRENCTVPGVAGDFDLIFDYELVPAPHGPGVAIRGRIRESSLAVGIAAVAYRQYLASTDAPELVVGGFTGAIEVAFQDLAQGAFDLSHPYLRSGGVSDVGYADETFMTTRTAETMLIAATTHPTKRHGLLATRDGRRDPDNIARELGFFGANPLAGSPSRFGFGLVGYLPNDDRAANGGGEPSVGSGLVVSTFLQENSDDPYWDVVRAYRSRWVDPMLAGIDKRAERPAWMERLMHMRLHVDHGGHVDVPAVAEFVDRFLGNNDEVRDLKILLWGATDPYLAAPLPGLAQLLQRFQQIGLARGVNIRSSLYHVPTVYWSADPAGGARINEVARDPFGVPVRRPDPLLGYMFPLDTDGRAAASWFGSWLDSLTPLVGVESVYFDDAFRNRSFDSYHYDPALARQGRLEDAVAAYIEQMHRTNVHFANRNVESCLTTELGIVGRSVPGNVVQGSLDVVQSLGPLFSSPEQTPRIRPFVNDVAGHHWVCGYGGDLVHQWLPLRGHDALLYFATPVVHGLSPGHSPFPVEGRYYDFIDLCNEGLIDCSRTRYRAVAVQTSYQNDATAFYNRHADILTRWRRQPLPGTTDIPERYIEYNGPNGTLGYQFATDLVPYGCFTAGTSLAIALTNPTFEPQTAGFSVARDRYGIVLTGNYRVTLQRLQDAEPRQLLESASGDLVFSVSLQPRELAMIMIEQACTFTSTPNTATCSGGTITGSSAAAPGGGQAVGIHLSAAPPQELGIMVFALSPAALPLPGSTCRLLIDTQPSIALPFATDANGAAEVGFTLRIPVTAHIQCLELVQATGAIVGTNALQLDCP